MAFRFSQFFISPTMNENSVDREMAAVNSEFNANLNADGWRLTMLEKALSQKDHDYYKFSCGNFTTLGDIPKEKGINVQGELIKFHDKWYSANIMSLCVLGKGKSESS